MHRDGTVVGPADLSPLLTGAQFKSHFIYI